MADQKIENLLNLALNATRREREKSLELDVGYSRDDKEWELIVKYSGTLNELREIGIQVVELSNEFAILTVPESLVERLADFPQIEYVEKPKRLFFQAANGRRVSCVVQGFLLQLSTQESIIQIRIFAMTTERQEYVIFGIRQSWEIHQKDI